eukprot:328077-Lingulodinium_polyedra.AAC.1
MDDFHGCGPEQAARDAVAELRETFDLKATDVFCTGRYSHLRRDRLRLGTSTLIRGNPGHVDPLMELYSMQRCRKA